MTTNNPNNSAIEEAEEERGRSMLRITASQFLEHRFAVAGLIVIGLFVLIAVSAPVISGMTGVDPNTQNIFSRYEPPMTVVEKSYADQEAVLEENIETDEARAQALLQAFFQNSIITEAPDDAGRFDPELLFEVLDMTRDHAFMTRLAAIDNTYIVEFVTLKRSFHSRHLLGTDELGRDVLMRLLYGTRISITVGLLVAIISGLIGLIIGSIAGYHGGIIDAILMRVTDALFSLPMIPLLIIFAAADLSKLPLIGLLLPDERQSMAKMVLILCLFSWMTVARLVRSSVLEIKEQEFVLAARTVGAADWRIIVQHMVPNVLGPLLVAVTLGVGSAILFEAALSFLGLGIQPPTPSWGNMLTNAQELIYEAPLLAILPGMLIFITVISFNFVGDGLQDAVDPKAIRR